MTRTWTEGRDNQPIDNLLARGPGRTSPSEVTAARYGEGEGRRRQQEREDVRETYPAMDIRLATGEYRGVFYYDLSGGAHMDPTHTTITVPIRRETLVIRGYRLEEIFRSILHHSLDILQVTHRPEFDVDDEGPVIASVDIVTQEARH